MKKDYKETRDVAKTLFFSTFGEDKGGRTFGLSHSYFGKCWNREFARDLVGHDSPGPGMYNEQNGESGFNKSLTARNPA